eukprot:7196110-Prymnesium_polylepis.1
MCPHRILKLEEFGKIYPVARPRAAFLRASYLLLNEKHSQAMAAFKKVQAMAKALSMPYEE